MFVFECAGGARERLLEAAAAIVEAEVVVKSDEDNDFAVTSRKRAKKIVKMLKKRK